jgi:hypothetical protein
MENDEQASQEEAKFGQAQVVNWRSVSMRCKALVVHSSGPSAGD